MADLHRFEDDAKTASGRTKPISAKTIDDNFRVCRTKIAGDDDSQASLEIVENFPQADEIRFKGFTGGEKPYPTIPGAYFRAISVNDEGVAGDPYWQKFEDCD